MNREHGWLWVVFVGIVAIVVSLIGAWRAMRDPAPGLSGRERAKIYESNLQNFAQSCEGRAGVPENAGLVEFCRKQAHLLRQMSECDRDCERRTSSFAAPDPSR